MIKGVIVGASRQAPVVFNQVDFIDMTLLADDEPYMYLSAYMTDRGHFVLKKQAIELYRQFDEPISDSDDRMIPSTYSKYIVWHEEMDRTPLFLFMMTKGKDKHIHPGWFIFLENVGLQFKGSKTFFFLDTISAITETEKYNDRSHS